MLGFVGTHEAVEIGHSRTSFFWESTIIRNIGAPRNDITTPTGMGRSVMVWLMMSAMRSSIAPKAADAGITRRESDPITRRTM